MSEGIDLARDGTDGDNMIRRSWVDAYGSTVRILPAHRLLASSAEVGLVAVPSEELGEVAGVLMR